jgi:hypothetical protein
MSRDDCLHSTLGTCWRHCSEVTSSHAKVMRDMLQERMQSHVDCIQAMDALSDKMRDSLVQLVRASWTAVEQEFGGWTKTPSPTSGTATPVAT